VTLASPASRERLSFSKLHQVLDRPTHQQRHRSTDLGSAEVLADISPIEDFTGTLKLELTDHVFDPPKHSEDECRERDMTYARPLFVTARFMNQTVRSRSRPSSLGDFPMMTDSRHVHHQRHRAHRVS
jgi:DNA-directed RNA polymerase subunit beta